MSFKTGLHPLGNEPSLYKINQLVFQKSTPGTYEIVLSKGCYKVILTGGGGSGGTVCPNVTGGGGGGSGGTIKGILKITHMRRIKITIGKGGASPAAQGWLNGNNGENTILEIDNKIIVKASYGNGSYAGGTAAPAAIANSFDSAYFTPTENLNGLKGENGNQYRAGYGGASTYQGYGKGTDGGWFPVAPGIGGFAEFVYIGRT